MSNVSLLFDGRCWAAARCRCRTGSRCTFQSEVIRDVRQRAGRSRQSSPVGGDHLPEAPALQYLTAIKWMAERLYRVSSIVLKSFKQSATLYITFTHSMHIIDIHTMHICHYTIYYFFYIYISFCTHILIFTLYLCSAFILKNVCAIIWIISCLTPMSAIIPNGYMW